MGLTKPRGLKGESVKAIGFFTFHFSFKLSTYPHTIILIYSFFFFLKKLL